MGCERVDLPGGIAVALVGARAFQALYLVRDFVLALPTDRRVVSGHAAGVDIVAEITARQREMATIIHPIASRSNASREAFTAAAMARNTLIADEAEEGVAWVNEGSRGTWDTIQKLRGLGKPIQIVLEPKPEQHALLLHTATHPRTQQAPRGYRGPSMFDITRGSGGVAGAPFAPSAGLLSEAQRRMREEGAGAFNWYAPHYISEMRQSWVRHRPHWDALLARNHVVCACFCAERTMCHRSLLAELLVKAGEKVGRRVVDGGEVVC